MEPLGVYTGIAGLTRLLAVSSHDQGVPIRRIHDQGRDMSFAQEAEGAPCHRSGDSGDSPSTPDRAVTAIGFLSPML